jgi:capsular polysaccharide biosynthesis protein
MVEADGAIFCDYPLSSSIMDEYIAGKRDVGVEESGFRKCEGGYKTFDLNQDVVESSTNLVIATSSEPLNYGAWLIRVLPKIMYARDVMGYSGYRFLVYADRDWQKGLLAFLGVPEKDYVPQRSNATYTAPMVILPSWPNTAGFLDERTIAMTVQLRTMAMARQPNFVSPKAIYVSRRLFDEKQKNATKVRPFAQELELESALANFGIVPFYPETVSFAETILTFANADLIVGRQGAAMSNCIFCRPGTQVVDIEHLSTFLKGHCNMFASCGLNYSLIIGRAYVGSDTHSVHKALEIDMPSTVEVIRGLLQS